MIDGQEFLTEFLEAGMACDEDGFATLTDKNGNTYVAQMNESEKKRYEDTGKKLSQVKKEKKESEGKKPESEKKTEEKSEKKEPEKKIKVKMSKGEIDFTKEEAKKQLDNEKNDLEELQTENKDLKEKKKAADKEKVGVDALLKFYKDYVGTLNKFEEDSNLNASRYYEKYKDRFTDLTGKELKQVKNDNRLDANMAQKNLDMLSEKEKDLFKKSYTYRNRIEQNDGLIKFHKENIKGITDALKREDMAQDSILTSYFEDIEIY
mgnify:CR=1 FL=1